MGTNIGLFFELIHTQSLLKKQKIFVPVWVSQNILCSNPENPIFPFRLKKQSAVNPEILVVWEKYLVKFSRPII